MTKLSTNEFTSSALLMTLVSGPKADESNVLQRVVDSAKDELAKKGGSQHDRVYDVRVMVNGVELDWHDFSKHVNETLDAWVAEEAEKLVKEILNPDLLTLRYEMEAALETLAERIRDEAERILGTKR